MFGKAGGIGGGGSSADNDFPWIGGGGSAAAAASMDLSDIDWDNLDDDAPAAAGQAPVRVVLSNDIAGLFQLWIQETSAEALVDFLRNSPDNKGLDNEVLHEQQRFQSGQVPVALRKEDFKKIKGYIKEIINKKQQTVLQSEYKKEIARFIVNKYQFKSVKDFKEFDDAALKREIGQCIHFYKAFTVYMRPIFFEVQFRRQLGIGAVCDPSVSNGFAIRLKNKIPDFSVKTNETIQQCAQRYVDFKIKEYWAAKKRSAVELKPLSVDPRTRFNQLNDEHLPILFKSVVESLPDKSDDLDKNQILLNLSEIADRYCVGKTSTVWQKVCVFEDKKASLGQKIYSDLILKWLNPYVSDAKNNDNAKNELVEIINFIRDKELVNYLFSPTDEQAERIKYKSHLKALLVICGEKVPGFDIDEYCRELVNEDYSGAEITVDFMLLLVGEISDVGLFKRVIMYSTSKFPEKQGDFTKILLDKLKAEKEAAMAEAQRQEEFEKQAEHSKKELEDVERHQKQKQREAEEQAREDAVRAAADRRQLAAELPKAGGAAADGVRKFTDEDRLVRDSFNNNAVWHVNDSEIRANSGDVFKGGNLYFHLPASIRSQVNFGGVINGREIKTATAQSSTGLKHLTGSNYEYEIKFLGSNGKGDIRIFFQESVLSSSDRLYHSPVVGNHNTLDRG